LAPVRGGDPVFGDTLSSDSVLADAATVGGSAAVMPACGLIALRRPISNGFAVFSGIDAATRWMSASRRAIASFAATVSGCGRAGPPTEARDAAFALAVLAVDAAAPRAAGGFDFVVRPTLARAPSGVFRPLGPRAVVFCVGGFSVERERGAGFLPLVAMVSL
jgi:hypothetical protein